MTFHCTFQIGNINPESRLGFHKIVFLIRSAFRVLFLILFSFLKIKKK